MKPPIETTVGYIYMFIGGLLASFSIPLGLTYPHSTFDTECIGLLLFTYGLYLLIRM